MEAHSEAPMIQQDPNFHSGQLVHSLRWLSRAKAYRGRGEMVEQDHSCSSTHTLHTVSSLPGFLYDGCLVCF